MVKNKKYKKNKKLKENPAQKKVNTGYQFVLGN